MAKTSGINRRDFPGDDPAQATSDAHYMCELLPKAEFRPAMPLEQTSDRVRERILEFGRTRRA
jgi:hypothetical protein